MDEVVNHQVSVEVLTIALEERDPYTRHHCDRVVVLARELGTACGLSHNEMQLLHLSALFHDIGKIGIPDHVLLKPAAFNDEEWSLMKAHSEKGERIVRSARTNFSDDLAPIIRHHHESFDGSGYPDGLSGEGIPFLSRLLLVVDAYDSISTARPYHGTKTHAEVMEIMNLENGEKFDPAILWKFTRLIDKSPLRVN